MYYRDLNVSDYEIVWAHRPVYNNSDELYPEDKKVRPFFVIKNLDDDKLLVSAVTSKKHPRHNYQVDTNTFVTINDFYIISKRDITKCGMILSKETVDNLFKKFYICLKRKESLYSDEIKTIFLSICKEYFVKETQNTFNKGDIIYLTNVPYNKYIIDDLSENIYWAYRVITLEKDNYEIDFSSRIMLEKSKYHSLYDSMDLETYNLLKKEKLNRIKQEKNNNNLYHRFDIETGGIIKYENKEYFVVFITSNNKYLCIPYQGNYLLDKIVTIDKNKVKFIKYLANSEIIEILNTLYSNINVQIDNKLQNKLYMKILDYK